MKKKRKHLWDDGIHRALKKILIVMKLTLILSLLLFTQAFALKSYSQRTLINLKMENVTIKEVLREIEDKSDFYFLYNNDLINVNRKVSIDVKNEKVQDVLSQLFADKNINFLVKDRQIVLSPLPVESGNGFVPAQKTKAVTGKVTDQSGGSLPGVSVVLKGTSTGTITDANGNYSISNIPDNATLLFSFVGMKLQEVAVGSKSTIDVVLHEESIGIEEVVAVGYGTMGRGEITASINKIDTHNIEKLTVSSTDQALSGQVAGVQVTQATGAPGSGSVIRIRGAGSIGAGDNPLYVVDGFPLPDSYDKNQNPFAAINPNDIESVSILKDASATAIYGSRGANGVILITTKRAKEGTSKIEVSAYGGVQYVPQHGRLKMMNASEFAQWRQEYRYEKAAVEGRTLDPSDIPSEYANPSSLGKGTDWYDACLQVAPIESINLSIFNGTKKAKSIFSVGYFDQDGAVLNTGYTRLSLRANIDYNVSDKLVLGVNINPVFNKWKYEETEGHYESSILTTALLLSPLVPVYQSDGSLTKHVTSTDTFDSGNPINILKNTKNKTDELRLLINGFVEFKPIKNLSVKSTYNIDTRRYQNDYFAPSFIGAMRNPPPQPASGSLSTSKTYDWLLENTINYQVKIADHKFSALGVMSLQKNDYSSSYLSGSGFPDDIVQTLNAATITSGSTNAETWSMVSYIGRLNYDYKEKYILTGTIRADGCSRFGANNKYGTFPSASFGWRITNEKFIPKVKWLSDLKLRLSYGLSGNNDIGNYNQIPQVVSSNYNLSGVVVSGKTLSGIANQNLGWEVSKQFDAGLDFILFDGRINLILDYYHRLTEDMLCDIDIPSSSGYGSILTNLGKIRNKGFEFSISSKNLEKRPLKWDTDFNISFNRNKVLNMGPIDAIYAGMDYIQSNVTKVGHPMGMFNGYQFVKIFDTQEEIDANPHYPDQIPGSAQYVDTNKDGEISEADKTIIGDPHPDFTFGLTNRFSYKSFDLSFLLTGSYGNQVMAVYECSTMNLDGVFNVEKRVADRWKSPTDRGNGKIASCTDFTFLDREGNSRMVYDASYIRIQNINLGYNVKTSFAEKLRLYCSVQNVWTFTKYPGNNPEVSYFANSNSLSPGIDYTGYPLSRIVTFGVNVTF
jgi:TonB-linked SusC/RagA family outer membrane protein